MEIEVIAEAPNGRERVMLEKWIVPSKPSHKSSRKSLPFNPLKYEAPK